MIVVLLYNLANNQGRLIWRDLIHSYVWPYYHLWYVTAYLAYYLFTIFLWKIIEKFGAYRIWFLLAFAGILSLCSKFQIWQYFTLPFMLRKLLEFAEHDFKMFYYIFFAVGAVARYQYEIGQERILTGIINQKDKKTGNRLRKTNQYVWLILGCSLSLTIVIILFFDNLPFFEYMAGYCWGILLLLLVLNLIQENKLPINRSLTFIGRNSYPIYLYHAFILIYFKSAFLNTDVRYYVLLTALFIVLCILVYYLKKIKWVDRYLFGNLKV